MSRRQSLKALAEGRGWALHSVPVVGGWNAYAFDAEWNRIMAECLVYGARARAKRSAEAGLRAALESMPLKRKGRG